MKTFAKVASQPVGLPILADDILEFHAARLVLLISKCGVANNIEGLTKLAKLDFFVRYPDFFRRAVDFKESKRDETGTLGSEVIIATASPRTSIESSMVRHHYGPWDRRYYRVLPFLEGCGLLEIVKVDRTYHFKLTAQGKQVAKQLSQEPSYLPLVEHMGQVKKAFGSFAGSTLKNLIYRLFDEEVGKKSLGEVI